MTIPDDTVYRVSLLLPVEMEVRARDEETASRMAARVKATFLMPLGVEGIGHGFPEITGIKLVETHEGAADGLGTGSQGIGG